VGFDEAFILKDCINFYAIALAPIALFQMFSLEP